MMKIKGINNEPNIIFNDDDSVVFSDSEVEKQFKENLEPKDIQLKQNLRIND